MARERKLIGEFLLELGDKKKLAAYRADPKGVLADSGLTKAQQRIILSNDLKKIRDAIRDEYRKANVIVVPLPQQNVAVSRRRRR